MNIFETDNIEAYLSELYQNQKYEDLNQQILSVFKTIDDFIINNKTQEDEKNEVLSQLANQIFPPLLELIPNEFIYIKVRHMIRIPFKAFYDDDYGTDCYCLLINSYKRVLKYINEQYDEHMKLAVHHCAYKIIETLLQKGIILTTNINCNPTINFFQMHNFLISHGIKINLQNYLRSCIRENNFELFQKLVRQIGDVKWRCDLYTWESDDYGLYCTIPLALQNNQEWTIQIIKNKGLSSEYWVVYINSNMEQVVQYLVEQNCTAFKTGIYINPMSKNITAYKLAKCKFNNQILNAAIRYHGEDSELVKFIKNQL